MKHGISPTTDRRAMRNRVHHVIVAMGPSGHNKDPGMHQPRSFRGLAMAHGPGSYAEGSPNQIRARMKAAGTWRGDFKATRG